VDLGFYRADAPRVFDYGPVHGNLQAGCWQIMAVAKSRGIYPDASSQGSDKQLGGGHGLIGSPFRRMLIGENFMGPANGFKYETLLKIDF
jgi:hypothetical protein